jgi:REP element-mobilizing transposase RayT
MARPLRIEYPDAFYHVTSRGNERKEVFRDGTDYKLFLKTLKESAEFFTVKVHSYCLMPNHFHLLLETKQPNLSKFMQRLLGVYTTRFNRKHKRCGHLFQGRYKALVVDKDSYLLELTRYIHLNPVKAGLAASPEDYAWSSMRAFLKGPSEFPCTQFILQSFRSKTDYKNFILSGIQNSKDPIKEAIGGLFLGSEKFVEKFKQQISNIKDSSIAGKRKLEQISFSRLHPALKEKENDFKIYAYWKLGKRTQKEIGNLVQRTDSAISHAIKKFEEKMQKDRGLRDQFLMTERVFSSFKL